jgi:transposase
VRAVGSIIKKKVKNYSYYYYVESKRIDGKPRLVNQKYLGTAEKVLEKVRLAEKPVEELALYSNDADFGGVMLLHDIATRLGIKDIIDNIIPKRKQGASVGAYILTAAINRAVDPASKSGLSEWYSNTCLPFATGLTPAMFTAQNFWNNTCISSADVDLIEESVLRRMIETYRIDTTHIIYDATNFFTYIDTRQESQLAKRGHCKHKRNDLRIVGLSLMVESEFSIPLLHETYPGNRADAKEFPIMMEKLKNRYEAIAGRNADVTVVFDRGNNSERNIDLLESGDFKLHYVGGLKRSEAKELFAIPLDEYTALSSPSLDGESAFRTEIDVYGRKVTAVIVHNPELEKGQMQGILINIEIAERKLSELQQRLAKRANGEITRGKKPTAESVAANLEKILKTEYMRDIFSIEVEERGGNICLSYETSREKLESVRLFHLGKTVLFTDRKDFTNEQIVLAYRSAWHVESAFRQMKDPDHLTVRPIFHWTDEKIRVHIFICVLAYRLCCLLTKELSEYGINIPINRLLEEMSRIKRVHTFFGDIGKPQKVETFTVGSELAEQIERLYCLKEKYS